VIVGANVPRTEARRACACVDDSAMPANRQFSNLQIAPAARPGARPHPASARPAARILQNPASASFEVTT